MIFVKKGLGTQGHSKPSSRTTRFQKRIFYKRPHPYFSTSYSKIPKTTETTLHCSFIVSCLEQGCFKLPYNSLNKNISRQKDNELKTMVTGRYWSFIFVSKLVECYIYKEYLVTFWWFFLQFITGVFNNSFKTPWKLNK